MVKNNDKNKTNQYTHVYDIYIKTYVKIILNKLY